MAMQSDGENILVLNPVVEVAGRVLRGTFASFKTSIKTSILDKLIPPSEYLEQGELSEDDCYLIWDCGM